MSDLRYAWRMVLKNPLFTIIVVATLALGIGLNTAVYAAVETMLLRPLPGTSAPSELVQVYRTYPGGQDYGSNSVPHYLDVRERSTDVFSGVASWTFVNLNVTAGGRPQAIFGQLVSANFFSVMGATPAQGRFFVPAEDSGRLAHPVAIVSDAGWKGVFGGDPNIVGRDVILNGQNYRIIGVARPEFVGVISIVSPVLWVPLMQIDHVRPGARSAFDSRGNNFMNVIARVRPGVSHEQVQQRLNQIVADLTRELPDNYERSGMGLVPQDEAGIHPTFRGAQIGLSAVVMSVVAILLLIACVNVANLFLARARDRAREMAIRLALGAKRWTLVRQLLVESLLFAAISGVAGLLLAVWVIGLANGITLPMDVDFRPDLQLNTTVLVFAMVITLVTGVLFGLVPALQATRPSLIPALKGEAAAGGSRSRIVRGLVVAQMALSMILLVCAGLFLSNLRSATAIDKGFVSDGLVLSEFDPALQNYDRTRTLEFYGRLSERLRANPQVVAVGMTDNVPLGFSNSDRFISVPGYVESENERMNINYASISPGYLGTMGIPLRAGRDFTAQDDSAAAPSLIVNEQFVKRFWPEQEAVGRTVRTGGRDFTVIGVVPTGKYSRLGEAPVAFMFFVEEQVFSANMSVLVRTSGDPAAIMALIRAEVANLDPNLPVGNLRTMDSHLGIALLPARLTGLVLGVFGLLGLVLASVGMYGVMAYSVSQRTREIGIRMATGASAGNVVRLVMRQGLSLVLVGLVLGIGGAVGASILLRSVLYGEQTVDLTTFTIVPLVLFGVAALATWVPARRAALVDPAITLRAD